MQIVKNTTILFDPPKVQNLAVIQLTHNKQKADKSMRSACLIIMYLKFYIKPLPDDQTE